MKCMFCNNPGTVRVTQVVNQKKRESHLCERCAREKNLLHETAGAQINLSALMNLLLVPAATDPTCPACGLTYAAFKAEGRFGCRHDYDTFRAVLEPLLERVHRATAHAGKLPAAWTRAIDLDPPSPPRTTSRPPGCAT
jgi:protein arginine kinase activator